MASTPVNILGVMVSCTFTDLETHRAALIKALHGQKLFALAMENDSAKLADVIKSSLQMVAESAAYIGLLAHKYGQVPEDATRNPQNLSITELEFNEAQRLGRPILLFPMSDDHDVKPKDIELDPSKRAHSGRKPTPPYSKKPAITQSSLPTPHRSAHQKTPSPSDATGNPLTGCAKISPRLQVLSRRACGEAARGDGPIKLSQRFRLTLQPQGRIASRLEVVRGAYSSTA